MKNKIMSVENLKKYYPRQRSLFGKPVSWTKALEDVSLELYEGEILGLVGESGCGKSTLGRQMAGLETPDQGRIFYRDRELTGNKREWKQVRTRIQMVFQDPYSSLNPRKRIREILAEPILYHGLEERSRIQKRLEELMELTGLPSGALERYPHEFSGGQRQRIAIAKALSLKPEILICDEPVSALDVSIQAQILNLLLDLREELNLTCLFIGHGLGAVRYVSHRVAVMYLGQVLELADSRELFEHPMHPYTQALLEAVPEADPDQRLEEGLLLEGEASGQADTGCPFWERCPRRLESCRKKPPILRPTAEGSSHWTACGPALEREGER